MENKNELLKYLEIYNNDKKLVLYLTLILYSNYNFFS